MRQVIAIGLIGLALPLSLAAAPSVRSYTVEFKGFGLQSRAVVSGIGFETEVLEFIATDDTIRILPGAANTLDLALSRPLTENEDWYEWTQVVVNRGDYLRTVVIRGFDPTGQEVVELKLANVWPFRWEITEPDVQGVRHERLLLAHELAHVLFRPGVRGTRLVGSDIEITYRVQRDITYFLERSLNAGTGWTIFRSGLSSADGILTIRIPAGDLADFATDRVFFRLRPEDDDDR